MKTYKIPFYGLRLVKERSMPAFSLMVRNAQDVAGLISKLVKDAAVEQFIVLFLDSQKQLLGMTTHKGTVTQAAIYPSEIFKTALLCNAVGLIAVHNHPSKNLIPSLQDHYSTRKLSEGAQLLGLSLLDHVILDGDGSFKSMLN